MFVITQGFLGPLEMTQGYALGAAPAPTRRIEEGGGAKRKRPPVRKPDRRQEIDRQNEEALALILIMELE